MLSGTWDRRFASLLIGRSAMTYGQLVANTSMNETIYHCFDHISKEDEPTFARKFRKQRDGWQKTHTFRELVLGAHLCGRGFNARYEQKVNLLTPDWSMFGNS